MPVSRQKKAQIWQDVTAAVSTKGSVVFANFHGLNVEQTNELRKKLKLAGVQYLVAKKSITKKVLGGVSVAGTIPALDGELAIASSEDQLSPARELYAFQQKFAGKLAILGGIFAGGYQSKAEMTAIATIPSEQQLRGMFVNVINSPIQGLVIALNAIAEKKVA